MTRPRLSLEQRTRERAWLRQRLAESQQAASFVSITSRARAFLQLAAHLISRARAQAAAPPDRYALVLDPEVLARRREFFGALDMIERVADGRPVYRIVDGEAEQLGALTGPEDPRLLAIARAASIAEVSPQDLTELAAKLEMQLRRRQRSNRRGLALAEQFMTTLPEPPLPPRAPPEPTRRSREQIRGANYDTAGLQEIVARLPGRSLKWAERNALAARMLGDLGDHLHAQEPEDEPAPVSPSADAMLVAAAAIVEKLEGKLAGALAEQNGPLDVALVRPVEEDVRLARRLLISYAVRVEPMARWPVGQNREARAQALAARRRVLVPPRELERAISVLGFAETAT